MKYLLDTNVCIRILNGSSPAVVDRLRELEPADVAISTVVRAELVFGARKSRHVAENLRVVDAFCSPFPSPDFDLGSADVYGAIRAELERAGRPIGPNDLLIAATALASSLILVTHNQGEFGRVPGLRLEDWEASDG